MHRPTIISVFFFVTSVLCFTQTHADDSIDEGDVYSEPGYKIPAGYHNYMDNTFTQDQINYLLKTSGNRGGPSLLEKK